MAASIIRFKAIITINTKRGEGAVAKRCKAPLLGENIYNKQKRFQARLPLVWEIFINNHLYTARGVYISL